MKGIIEKHCRSHCASYPGADIEFTIDGWEGLRKLEQDIAKSFIKDLKAIQKTPTNSRNRILIQLIGKYESLSKSQK